MADQPQRHRFDAGRISLDLMATLGNRCAERLPDPAALEAWLLEAGMVGERCPASAADLTRARGLRAALFAVVEAELHGARPAAEDLATINAVAAARARAPRLALAADGLRCERATPHVSELLGEIGRDAITLLTGPQRSLLRECAADDCSGIYVDTSRAHTRRWCSTARCGNRARVAAHRARQRDASDGSTA